MLLSVLSKLDDCAEVFHWRVDGKVETLSELLSINKDEYVTVMQVCGFFGPSNIFKKRAFDDCLNGANLGSTDQVKLKGTTRPTFYLKVGRPTQLSDIKNAKKQLNDKIEATHENGRKPRILKTERQVVDLLVKRCQAATKVEQSGTGSDAPTNTQPMAVSPLLNAIHDDQHLEYELRQHKSQGSSRRDIPLTPVLDKLAIDTTSEVLLTSIVREAMGVLLDRTKRCVEVEHWGGKKQLVAMPSRSTTLNMFFENATRSRWIEILFEGELSFLLQWLATKHAPLFQTFARQHGGGLILSTVETQALKSYCKLTKNQLLNLCGFFGSRYRIKLRNNPAEIKKLQSCTGKLPNPVFGVYDYDNPKHGLDVCKFWTLDYGEEVERAADELLQTMSREEEALLPFDYKSPLENDSKGINVIIGGDHGDIAFRYHAMFQFSSPTTRKDRGQLSYRCRKVQLGFIECRKDTYNVLANTIARPLRSSLEKLRRSSLIVIYSTRRKGLVKSIVFPRQIDYTSIRIIAADKHSKGGTWKLTNGSSFTIDLHEMFDSCKQSELSWYIGITAFNDFHIGDLEFVNNELGQVNSSSCWCPYCPLRKGMWGKGCIGVQRTEVSQLKALYNFKTQRFTEYLKKKGFVEQAPSSKFDEIGEDGTVECKLLQTGKCFFFNAKQAPALSTKVISEISLKNVDGVNAHALLGAKSERTLIPTLHSCMGLAGSKLLPALRDWLLLYGEALSGRPHEIRKRFVKALIEEHEDAPKALKEEESKGGDLTDENMLLKLLKLRCATAKRNRVAVQKEYVKMQKGRKRKKGTLAAKFDEMLCKHGAEIEHYHGGTIDGGSCRALMKNCKALFIDITAHVESTFSEQACEKPFPIIRAHISKFEHALAMQDVIWSSVRGIDGMLPTSAFLSQLESDILKGRKAWLDAGLNIAGHPKAHLTFDGHLLDQIKRFGGLADKGEDWIEHLHQLWTGLKQLTWQIPNFEKQQSYQIATLRTRENAIVVATIDATNEKRKRNLKRTRDGGSTLKEEKDVVRRETKLARREEARSR
jgi:hypothetical protein